MENIPTSYLLKNGEVQTPTPFDPAINRIVCAATRFSSGVVIPGVRHYDMVMIEVIDKLKEKPSELSKEVEQGFLDRFGVFKTRQEAWKIAYIAKQVIRRAWGDGTHGGTLYSENLY